MNTTTKRIDWVETKRRLAISQELIEPGFVHSDEKTQEIFQRRSLELARRKSEISTERGCRTLVLALGAERYCLELAFLREVLPFGKCTPVPGAPPEFLGLINLRGEIRSVISLSRLLGLDSSEAAERAGRYVVMLVHGSVEVGLQVDTVERIAFVSFDSLNLPDRDGAGLTDRYVRGVTPDGLIMVDPAAIVSHPIITGPGPELISINSGSNS